MKSFVLKLEIFYIFFVAVFLFFFLAGVASAQFLGSINLESSPKTPEPYEKTIISIDQYGIDTFGANIRWYVDGVEQAENNNARTLEIVMGGLLEKTTVSALISQNSGLSFETSLELIPRQVDLIIESDTSVPIFYKGRALPSKDSSIRAVAIPHGISSSYSDYTYKWLLDNVVLFGGPVRGKSSAELKMPLFRDSKLRVEVYDSLGNMLTEKTLRLSPQEPELHFYEKSPLRGLSEKAVGPGLFIFGRETVVSGEPYYLDNTTLARDTDFTWKVGGKRVSYDLNKPKELSLSTRGDVGSTPVSLEILTTVGIPEFIKKAFNASFQ